MPSIRHTGDPEIDSLNTDVAKEIALQHAHEEPTEHHDHDHDEHAHGVDWQDLVRILFVALAAAAVWFRVWEPLAHFSIIGIAATLIGGYPIFKEAVENIFEGRMTMELSMTIALVAALAVGEFFTALVIALFVLAAECWKVSRLGGAAGQLRDWSICCLAAEPFAAMARSASFPSLKFELATVC